MANPTGVLTPAYGRDYKSLKSAQADFNEGKDFQLNTFHGSTYCSIRDFTGKGKIQARYSKNTKTGSLTYNC